VFLDGSSTPWNGVKSWQPGDRPNQVVRARPASKFDPVPRPGDVAQTGALHAQMGGQVTAVRDLIERGDGLRRVRL